GSQPRRWPRRIRPRRRSGGWGAATHRDGAAAAPVPPAASYQSLRLDVLQPECFGDGGIHHLPLDHAEPERQRPIVLARLLPSMTFQPLGIRTCPVGDTYG